MELSSRKVKRLTVLFLSHPNSRTALMTKQYQNSLGQICLTKSKSQVQVIVNSLTNKKILCKHCATQCYSKSHSNVLS
jgi:hypothetical protein